VADIKDFKLPDLGEGLEEGDIVEWHVAVGDVIELNQTVADIETAKAVVAVPSPFAGKVVELVGEVGETLEVGSVFVRIDVSVEGGEVADDGAGPVAEGEASPAQAGFEAGAAAAEVAAPDADAEPSAAVKGSTGLDADEEPQPLVGYGQGKGGARRRRAAAARRQRRLTAQGATTAVKPLAKPPVRKLAKDLGVDLAAIAPGSGPAGIITRDDVHAHAASGSQDLAPLAPPPAAAGAGAPGTAAAAGAGAPQLRAVVAGERPVPGFRGREPGEVEQIRGIRKRIVEKMEVSRREIPAASCTREADLTELWEVRKQLTALAHDEGFDVKITPFALLMRARCWRCAGSRP
jgi:2-oxoisovalerate dehydrogenase E2 component (dihydrolipoyl transacylase)